MRELAESIVAALEPYVGRVVADTCVRATALSIGKTAERLDVPDLPAVEENVRKLLGPIAPSAVVEGVLSEIRGAAA